MIASTVWFVTMHTFKEAIYRLLIRTSLHTSVCMMWRISICTEYGFSYSVFHNIVCVSHFVLDTVIITPPTPPTHTHPHTPHTHSTTPLTHTHTHSTPHTPPPPHTHTLHPHTGPKGNGGPAKEYIKDLFNNLNPNPENQRVFAHFTEATDTKNIERVFTAVREHVLEENLKDYNLM